MEREAAHECGEWCPTVTEFILSSDSLLNLRGTYTLTDDRVAAAAFFALLMCILFARLE